jgi:hypothetical protein
MNPKIAIASVSFIMIFFIVGLILAYFFIIKPMLSTSSPSSSSSDLSTSSSDTSSSTLPPSSTSPSSSTLPPSSTSPSPSSSTSSSPSSLIPEEGTYNIKNLNTYLLSSQSCPSNISDLFNLDDGSGRQQWILKQVSGLPNYFNIIVSGGRNGCNQYLSASDCTDNRIDIYDKDDGSGRQQWIFKQIGNNTYNIINVGRQTCEKYLGATSPTGGISIPLIFYKTDDGSGLQQWILKKI